jgi:hypothetical protein
MVAKFLQPTLHVLVSEVFRNVIDQQCSNGTSVVPVGGKGCEYYNVKE